MHLDPGQLYRFQLLGLPAVNRARHEDLNGGDCNAGSGERYVGSNASKLTFGSGEAPPWWPLFGDGPAAGSSVAATLASLGDLDARYGGQLAAEVCDCVDVQRRFAIGGCLARAAAAMRRVVSPALAELQDDYVLARRAPGFWVLVARALGKLGHVAELAFHDHMSE